MALIRQQCEHCGAEEFALYYDDELHGFRVQCARCDRVVPEASETEI